jgi:hypothetical protein
MNVEAYQDLIPRTEHEAMALRARLCGSLLLFTQFFYKLRTGRNFDLSLPVSRESHYITVCRELTHVAEGKTKRLLINIPPRYGKTELLIHFVAWTLAKNPSNNYIYISYSHSLAKTQTQTIRSILQLPLYKKIFKVELSPDSTAKGNFKTTAGGNIYAAGAGGTITGFGSGIHGGTDIGGALIIDDIHKPDQVTSDVIRANINEWWFNTCMSRVNNPNTPIVGIGQRLHEDDLFANFAKNNEWKSLIIPALDIHNNALHPGLHTTEKLLEMKEASPYNFAAQYQQNPIPAGGSVFKPEWFELMDEEPNILVTFITADTAETDKTYNDATVFSFWGLYKIVNFGRETDAYALHWIDCYETRIEPKDLHDEFMAFYQGCMMHKVAPSLAAIEKKSTGVTLLSVLKEMRGIRILEVERNANSLNKAARFYNIQGFVAKKCISLPRIGRHTVNCLEHCRKITGNNSHRFDDIADTLYDAIKIALIDKILINYIPTEQAHNKVLETMAQKFNYQQQIRSARYGNSSIR